MSPLAAASPLKALDPNVLANADTPVDAKNILKSRLRPKPRAHSPSAKSFGDIGDDDDDDDDSAYEGDDNGTDDEVEEALATHDAETWSRQIRDLSKDEPRAGDVPAAAEASPPKAAVAAPTPPPTPADCAPNPFAPTPPPTPAEAALAKPATPPPPLTRVPDVWPSSSPYAVAPVWEEEPAPEEPTPSEPAPSELPSFAEGGADYDDDDAPVAAERAHSLETDARPTEELVVGPPPVPAEKPKSLIAKLGKYFFCLQACGN